LHVDAVKQTSCISCCNNNGQLSAVYGKFTLRRSAAWTAAAVAAWAEANRVHARVHAP
jgi:hypothetical protein